MDFVHVGDLDGSKGIYLINAVDPDRLRSAVTQYEFIGAVAAISERFLLPVLEGLLDLFPFAVMGFHAGNASRRDAPAPSTSTRKVARLLAKLHAEFTKSRARHSNDNALVDARRPGGLQERQRRAPLARPRPHTPALRAAGPRVRPGRPIARRQLPPALHVRRRARRRQGRVRRRYPHDQVATTYERFRRIDGAERFLKPGVAFADLDRDAHAASDLAALREVNRARAELFRTIGLASDAESAA